MNPQLTAALAPLLRDLSVPGGVRPVIRDEPWPDKPKTTGVLLFGADGSGLGIHLILDRPFPAQVAQLAGEVQDWAVDELGRLGRPAAWPRCPHHPRAHALDATERDGRAIWRCPALDTEVSAIGALNAAG